MLQRFLGCKDTEMFLKFSKMFQKCFLKSSSAGQTHVRYVRSCRTFVSSKYLRQLTVRGVNFEISHRFKRCSNLLSHVLSVHAKALVIPCNLCDVNFAEESQYFVGEVFRYGIPSTFCFTAKGTRKMAASRGESNS